MANVWHHIINKANAYAKTTCWPAMNIPCRYHLIPACYTCLSGSPCLDPILPAAATHHVPTIWSGSHLTFTALYHSPSGILHRHGLTSLVPCLSPSRTHHRRFTARSPLLTLGRHRYLNLLPPMPPRRLTLLTTTFSPPARAPALPLLAVLPVPATHKPRHTPH